MINECTRCNKKIKELKLFIGFKIEAERETSIETWESIGNMSMETKEVVCQECFNKFVKAIDFNMNKS